MKKIIVTLLIVGIFSSCESLLDTDAENTISGSVLVDQASIEKALNGAYYNLMGMYDGSDGGELLGGDFKLMAILLTRSNQSEVAWDHTNGETYGDFIDKDIRAANFRVEANWRRAYEIINMVNDILDNIDNVEDAEVRSRIQGEALAIRGILYFEMVRLWAPQYGSVPGTTPAIPLILEPVASVSGIKTPEKASIEAVYTRAETDLGSASQLLEPLGKNGTRVSYYVCEAYLGKVAMQKAEDFSEAEQHFNNVINGPFQLVGSSLQAFNNKSNTSEDILAVQQSAAVNTGSRSTGTGLVTFFSALPKTGLGVMRIFSFSLNTTFLSNNPRFGAQDVRGSVDLDILESTPPDAINTAFYRDPINTDRLACAKFLREDDVIPVIRLAEIKLARAEAIFEQNRNVIDSTALGDLNDIRTRAGLSALQESDFGNPGAFYDSLILEMNRELIYEGIIFHDLKRRATYLDDIRITGNDPLDDKFILPIPQAECDASPGLCD